MGSAHGGSTAPEREGGTVLPEHVEVLVVGAGPAGSAAAAWASIPGNPRGSSRRTRGSTVENVQP
ncbi:hypothetical protein, partial [Nocardia sp. 852002-51101_SCH5132738]|uniref:hypothetical protein n=1 Tax=Nocardia sp. 852002-51101_SCH5132738 TaxID=1834095 RepID=UPI001E5F5EBB